MLIRIEDDHFKEVIDWNNTFRTLKLIFLTCYFVYAT